MKSSDTGYDMIAISLQEICELSAMNLLGDKAREEQWQDFVIEQIAWHIPIGIMIVGHIGDLQVPGGDLYSGTDQNYFPHESEGPKCYW